MELVSIIITVFGDGGHLSNAIVSAMNQDYTNIEIIVVDDNGLNTYNQKKVSDVVILFKDKVRYIAHKKNCNGSVARNTGFEKSSGDFILFLDDDDELPSNKISKQVEILKKTDNNWGACYSSKVTHLNGQVVSRKRAIKSGDLLYSHLMHNVRLSTGSLLIKRVAFQSIGGYDSSYWRHQDWEMGARLASKYHIVATDETHFIRNITKRNSPKIPEKSEEYMSKFINDIDILAPKLSENHRKNVVSKNYMSIAMKYLKKGNIRKFLLIYREHKNGLRGIKYFFYFLIIYVLPLDNS